MKTDKLFVILKPGDDNIYEIFESEELAVSAKKSMIDDLIEKYKKDWKDRFDADFIKENLFMSYKVLSLYDAIEEIKGELRDYYAEIEAGADW